MRKLLEFVGIIALLFIVGAGIYSFFNLGVFNNIDTAIQVFDGLGWFVTLFGIATVFTSYLVVIADTKFLFRFLAIPAWLAFSFALLATLDQFIGYPYPGIPPKAQVLEYRVLFNDDKSRTIEAWMYLPKDSRTRAYSFPHTPDREESLYKGMQAKSRGENSLVDMEPSGRAGQLDMMVEDEDMVKHDIRHAGLPLKEGETAADLLPNEDPGQEVDRTNKFTVQLPGGEIIEVLPGNSFTISDQGEIEIFTKRTFPLYDSAKGHGRGGVPGQGDPRENDHFDGRDYEGGTHGP